LPNGEGAGKKNPNSSTAKSLTMASRSTLSFAQRATDHPNLLVKTLFGIAERKTTNVVLSADLTTTKELLAIADSKSSA
jgi:hypothetical protein